jgi:hypothetical protein
MAVLLAALVAALIGLWLTTNKVTYPTASSGTGGIHSLATSSTFLAGYEWFVIDNTTELALDYLVQGYVTVGTTPTANTQIRIYCVASYDGTTWPDVFDGTPSAETVTSAGVGSGFLVLASVINVDATTSNVAYPFRFSLASLFGGYVPKKTAIFVAHNTGVNLNSTSGNQAYGYAPQDTTNG